MTCAGSPCTSMLVTWPRYMRDDSKNWGLRTRLERDLTLTLHLPTELRALRRYAPASVSCLSRKPTLVPALGWCVLESPSSASRGMPGSASSLLPGRHPSLLLLPTGPLAVAGMTRLLGRSPASLYWPVRTEPESVTPGVSSVGRPVNTCHIRRFNSRDSRHVSDLTRPHRI